MGAHLVRRKGNQMENLTSYTVKVHSVGHTIVHKGRAVRTPVVFENVYEHELMLIESQLKSRSLDYTIDENKEEIETVIEPVEIIEQGENDVQIEELYPQDKTEPESIMDKLISENS